MWQNVPQKPSKYHQKLIKSKQKITEYNKIYDVLLLREKRVWNGLKIEQKYT